MDREKVIQIFEDLLAGYKESETRINDEWNGNQEETEKEVNEIRKSFYKALGGDPISTSC